jgi:hypothetical protein
MPIIDQSRTYKDVEAKLAQTTNPRHRLLLERVLQHAIGEVEADLEAVMDSLSANPVYRLWSNPDPKAAPAGRENVRRYYADIIFGLGRAFIESNKDRIVVDDNTVITEGWLRTVMWGRDVLDMGRQVDNPDAYYLIRTRLLNVWPCDAEGYIIGEETYSGAASMSVITDENEVPDNIKAYVAKRKQQLAVDA